MFVWVLTRLTPPRLPCPQVSYKGFGVPAGRLATRCDIQFEGTNYSLGHGSVVIAAITSCTNTSNPSVMLAAGQAPTTTLHQHQH